jgi:hypothetical protein
MWLKWLPWRFVVRRVASAHGLLDPVAVLARLQRFAEPTEVAAPLELLRAGVVFHARGLMNSAVIQHNLDWIWPYWVERQFDPHDDAFIPRAFSITHVNLTHRNWTAVGQPDCDQLPIVDPRGLLTPFWDGWSLDPWIVAADGRRLIPSQLPSVRQRLETRDGVAVITSARMDGLELTSSVDVEVEELAAPSPGRGGLMRACCRLRLSARADRPAWLAVALRPYNPEGVSFIHDVALDLERSAWRIEGRRQVEFSERVDAHRVSRYKIGDVHPELAGSVDELHTRCDVGMATAAAMFKIAPREAREITVSVPFGHGIAESSAGPAAAAFTTWSVALRPRAVLEVSDPRFQYLYEAAVRTLVLHTPAGDVYPGPYTYKRFWFRDAAFILNALLAVGLGDRARRAIDAFPKRQNRSGYFVSQVGEWDSNGAALWIMRRYCQLTGQPPDAAWGAAIRRGGRWIVKKRLADTANTPHAGLLPAGFSAEHLGPNDYYYWDDYWGIAGLRAAASLCESQGDRRMAGDFRGEADSLERAVEKSLAAWAPRRRGMKAALPASPYRRMDAGAIGSIVAGYPLQLLAADDPRLSETIEFLLEHCFVDGGFFQDMVHSGINAYLTLHVAQVLLRTGDPRAQELMRSVADMATSTGQWPEAIHPRTRGGCMGDGQHVWAAAEWVMMMRNCFLREEGERLILASGIPHEWLEQTAPLSFGPAPTPWGDVTLTIEPSHQQVGVRWQGAWRGDAPRVEVWLPGHPRSIAPVGFESLTFQRARTA